MKKKDFIEELAEYCEFENEEELLQDTLLKDIEGYDSLAVMTMIAFIDENFGVKLSASELEKITDFNSIIELIGEDKFEND